MIQIYTDGSCAKGKGGYASVIIIGNQFTLIGRSKSNTTCNQMELMGLISGLQQTPDKSNVKIISDSEYSVKGFNTWMHKWQAKGWMRTAEHEAKNKGLWQQLFDLKKTREVKAEWIRAHVNSDAIPHVFNGLCDVVATFCREEQNQITLAATSLKELITKLNERYFIPLGKTSRFLQRHGIQRDGMAETS